MTRSEEHQIIANKAQDCKNAAQTIYEVYHNGDKKLNKMIMNIKDNVLQMETLLNTHIGRTGGDDAKIDKYNTIVTLAWVFGTAFVGSLATLLAKVFDWM